MPWVQAWSLINVWPWANYVTFLGLSSLICENRIMKRHNSQGCSIWDSHRVCDTRTQHMSPWCSILPYTPPEMSLLLSSSHVFLRLPSTQHPPSCTFKFSGFRFIHRLLFPRDLTLCLPPFPKECFIFLSWASLMVLLWPRQAKILVLVVLLF
jgi:hypothetical protein